MHPGPLSYALLVAFCAAAVISDLRRHLIPNALNALGLCAGLAAACVFSGAGALASCCLGSLLGASAMLPFFLLRMVGGGDLKFLAASGAIAGWRVLCLSLLVGAVLGGAIGFVLLVLKDRSIHKLKTRAVLIGRGPVRPHDSGTPVGISGLRDINMPYALPLSIGLVAAGAILCRWW